MSDYLLLFFALAKNFFRFSLRRKAKAMLSSGFYIRDYVQLKKQLQKHPFPLGKFNPCLGDRADSGGVAKGHYFHQDLLVAQRIFANKPQLHVDIGSRIDGFGAHVAAFMPLEVWDIRPVQSAVKNIKFKQFDITAENSCPADYCDSLSCLHVLEHFGLGRYGDSVDARAHLTGFANMCAVLKPHGKFYFSAPIGRQRIEFNAHRIFSVEYLLSMFQERNLRIDAFSYVDDKGDLHENAELSADSIRNSFSCKYGCGIFELTKNAPAQNGGDVSL